MGGFFIPFLYEAGMLLLIILFITVAVDLLLIYSKKDGITATRQLPERFSMSDENKVTLTVSNHYWYWISAMVIDELPFQFQVRDWKRFLKIAPATNTTLEYFLKPVSRGEYLFGNINIIANGPLKLVKRRFEIKAEKTVKAYPSFVQMRRFQLLAISNRLQEAGIKQLRKLGHSTEFEQIKEYVRGDDYRTINWKATSRKGALMINNYVDEKSQQIYCVINKGRIMKMPFEGMTLLDYSINASLILSNVALVKQDKAGLISFAEKQDTFLTADKKPGQMNLILELLYRQETNFWEADYEKLYATIRNKINNRSLIVLFTNFESLEGLRRNLPALKKIARFHLLLVVIFENTAIKELFNRPAENLENVYIKTIAEKFSFEKKLMVKELQQNGILTILTNPEQLTVNIINKYLELKNRNYI